MLLTQRVLLWLTLLGASTACQTDVSSQLPLTGTLYQSDFSTGPDNWKADFADYHLDNGDMQLASNWTSLPKPLDTGRKSLSLSGINRSDDLFMYMTRKLTGLRPNTDYTLTFSVELASQYAANSIGIGGSPGGSVYLKAGATSFEPKRQLVDGFYQLNIDKGNQLEGGRDAQTLGTIGITDDAAAYTLITRTNEGKPQTVRSSPAGELWLIVGTDSGYEGLTTLYYSRITVTAR
ncbi:hypothetical protein GCM10027578_04620 [Spirosoma luteolum]